jgi:hypothetical protein
MGFPPCNIHTLFSLSELSLDTGPSNAERATQQPLFLPRTMKVFGYQWAYGTGHAHDRMEISLFVPQATAEVTMPASG